MQTTYTKKELIKTAVEKIRIYVRLYRKNRELEFIHAATDVANALETLNIINIEKRSMLVNIITESIRNPEKIKV